MYAEAGLELEIDEPRNRAQKDEHKPGSGSDNPTLKREDVTPGMCHQPEIGTMREPNEQKAGHRERDDKMAVLAHAEEGVAEWVEVQGVHVERIDYALGTEQYRL